MPGDRRRRAETDTAFARGVLAGQRALYLP